MLPVRVLYSILLLVGSLPCRNPKCETRKNVPAIHTWHVWVHPQLSSSLLSVAGKHYLVNPGLWTKRRHGRVFKGRLKKLTASPSLKLGGAMEEISGKCRVLCWQKPQCQFFFTTRFRWKHWFWAIFPVLKKIWAGNYLSEWEWELSEWEWVDHNRQRTQ